MAGLQEPRSSESPSLHDEQELSDSVEVDPDNISSGGGVEVLEVQELTIEQSLDNHLYDKIEEAETLRALMRGMEERLKAVYEDIRLLEVASSLREWKLDAKEARACLTNNRRWTDFVPVIPLPN